MPGVYTSERDISISPRRPIFAPLTVESVVAPPEPPSPYEGNNGSWSGWSRSSPVIVFTGTITITE